MPSHRWKVLSVEILLRLGLILISIAVLAYITSTNWDWYNNQLEHITKQPNWANSTINLIIVSVWFAIVAFVWNHHYCRPERHHYRLDFLYPVILILVILMFILFFELRDFNAAKWVGVASVIVMAYLLYEAFVCNPFISGLLIVNFGILVYVVAQIWYYSKHVFENPYV